MEPAWQVLHHTDGWHRGLPQRPNDERRATQREGCGCISMLGTWVTCTETRRQYLATVILPIPDREEGFFTSLRYLSNSGSPQWTAQCDTHDGGKRIKKHGLGMHSGTEGYFSSQCSFEGPEFRLEELPHFIDC